MAATKMSKCVHIKGPILSGVPGPEHFEIISSEAKSCTAEGEIRLEARQVQFHSGPTATARTCK